jgi:hypothetical protein
VRRRFATALSLTLCLAACGSSSDSTPAVPDARVEPPDAAPPDAMPHPVSCAEVTPTAGMVAGVAYEREAFRAYGVDGPFFEGVGGAEVDVDTVVAGATEACGEFLVAATPGSLVSLRKEGFAESWFLHLGDVQLHQDVGLYREQPVTPRPGFLKGVYVDTSLPSATVDLILETYTRVAGLGARLVVDKRFIDILDVDAHDNVVEMSTAALRSTAEYRMLAEGAHARGLELLLIARVEPHTFGNSYFDVTTANMINDPFWDAWFAAYTEAVVTVAGRARDAGVDVLALNGGGGQRQAATRWAGVLTAIRAAGFTGRVMYLGTASVASDGTLIDTARANFGDAAPFLTQFDVVGLTVTNVYGSGAPRSRTAMSKTIQDLASEAGAGTRPVVLFLDTAATTNATTSDEYFGLCEHRTLDLAQQADVYQAAFEAVNAGAAISGVFTVDFQLRDDMCGGDMTLTGDTSPSVRGKPAEAVLKWWFQRL